MNVKWASMSDGSPKFTFFLFCLIIKTKNLCSFFNLMELKIKPNQKEDAK